MINVIQPGLETTVQDAGRLGHYHIGMPPSGAMDKYAYTVGNLLVGNEENAASLEMTYLGPELEFEEAATIALTGGHMPPKINGKPAPMWETITVQAGDALSFDLIQSGARIYLGVAGGIDVPNVLGSRSTYTLCGIGGFEGRPLKAGDRLKIGAQAVRKVTSGARLPDQYIPSYGKHHEIRIVEGLCNYRLTDESKQRFLDVDWTVTPEANRVGYRFKGERLDFIPREQPFGAGSNPSNVTDLGYPVGSIQVPDGVEPIALLNDAVTGGGYATIATVISVDLDRMGQVKTNETVRFISVTLEEALEARRDMTHKIAEIKEWLANQ